MRAGIAFAFVLSFLFTTWVGAAAQEVTGTPGSPSATTTIFFVMSFSPFLKHADTITPSSD